MRAAVLHLGFAGFGAERAVTSAFADNPRSLGVTRALGYAENGWFVDDREGKPAKHLRFVLERADWSSVVATTSRSSASSRVCGC